MEESPYGRHVCCSSREQEELVSSLNEYICKMRQRDAMLRCGKYSRVPEFMKTKQPRYEENKEVQPLITNVPVMEYRVTYDKNKIKENQDHPNMTYILIEDCPNETEKVPDTCRCCNMRCFSFYPQSSQAPSYNICFPCYYYCYPYNQYSNKPQETCLFQQAHQCQPVRLQSTPQYCVPNWSHQPCFHWGEGCMPGCQPAQDVSGCNPPVDGEQKGNCENLNPPGHITDINVDIQPSDGRPIRPISAKGTDGKKGKKRLLNDEGNSEQQIKLTNGPKPINPQDGQGIHVYNAIVSLDKPAEDAMDPPNLPNPQDPPKEEPKEVLKEEPKEAPTEAPKEEVKTEPERAIKPYKRYRLRAPYMYDISDSELYS